VCRLQLSRSPKWGACRSRRTMLAASSFLDVAILGKGERRRGGSIAVSPAVEDGILEASLPLLVHIHTLFVSSTYVRVFVSRNTSVLNTTPLPSMNDLRAS
jgi:hypothetical protein